MISRQRALLKIALSVSALVALSINCARPDRLRRFSDCQELEDFLKDKIVNPPQTNVRAAPASMFFACEAPMAADESAGTNAPTSDRAEASSYGGDGGNKTYTTTNTQERDVDEADFVKNDGDYIFVLRRGHLMVFDAWPADQTHVVADVLVNTDAANPDFVGFPFTMFYDGQHLMVVAAAGQGWRPVREGDVSAPWTGGTVVSLYDVSDPGAPALQRKVRIDGSFVDARRVGDQVLLVTSSQIAWPVVGGGGIFQDDAMRERIDRVALSSLLPGIEDQDVANNAAPQRRPAAVCSNTYAAEDADGRNLLLVHSLSISEPAAEIRSTSVVSAWSTLYASTESLYLAVTEWSDGGYFTPALARTRLHKFSIFGDDGLATYQATGVVEGQIHNQFSMDEHEGRMRMVITTDQQGMSSSLVVLEQDGDALVEVGRVDEIGRDEFVQSVRFVDDVAYIVTYPGQTFSRRVPPQPPNFWDPLWTVDLSDPVNPRVRGELQVDGYSTYIHPIDADNILTIGIDTDPNNVIRGLSLSIFDVSDLDHPALKHRHRFGDGFSWSDAVNDHHAFNYFADNGTLAIPLQLANMDPVTGWWGGLDSSGLEVFKVDVERGFTHLGRIEQAPLFDTNELDAWTVSCIDVRRSVMIADDNGAYVYAISTGGLSVAEIAPGLPEVASIPFFSRGDPLCPDTQLPL